jgi:hypothetical protein
MRASTSQVFDGWPRGRHGCGRWTPTSAGSPRSRRSASEGSMGAAAILLTRRKRRASHSVAPREICLRNHSTSRSPKNAARGELASSRSIPSATAVHFRAIDKAYVRTFQWIWTDLPSTRLFLAYTPHRADVRWLLLLCGRLEPAALCHR